MIKDYLNPLEAANYACVALGLRGPGGLLRHPLIPVGCSSDTETSMDRSFRE